MKPTKTVLEILEDLVTAVNLESGTSHTEITIEKGNDLYDILNKSFTVNMRSIALEPAHKQLSNSRNIDRIVFSGGIVYFKTVM